MGHLTAAIARPPHLRKTFPLRSSIAVFVAVVCGVIEPGALYEAPFTGLHAGGPDGLFAGKSEMITVLFQAIEATQPVVQSSAG